MKLIDKEELYDFIEWRGSKWHRETIKRRWSSLINKRIKEVNWQLKKYCENDISKEEASRKIKNIIESDEKIRLVFASYIRNKYPFFGEE